MADDDWAQAVDSQEIRTQLPDISAQVKSLNLANKTPSILPTSSSGSVAPPAPAAPAAPAAPPAPAAPAAPADDWEDGDAAAPEKAPDAASMSLLNKKVQTELYELKNDTVEVQRKDPNSPLYSVRSFEEMHLKPEILKGVYAMGFNHPSKIQETAIPSLLADPPINMIAQSQSGTGKTAAFSVAMLSRVDNNLSYPQALLLSPTYELALQTGKVIETMAKYYTNFKVAYAVRGNMQARGTKLTEQIVIGTPGTMLDWAIKFKFFDMKKIKVFVLDEADVMIDTQGHQDQSIRLHRQLASKTCQQLLFSATYTPQVMNFAERVVEDPLIIRLRREEESLDNIRQYYIECQNLSQKHNAIANLYGTITIGQCIIFCHTRKTASWLAGKLSEEGHRVAMLSGELTIEQRAAVINRFRAGNEKILITTNVSARGIDVAQVTVVINFDLPIVHETKEPDFETYLHRIGRTGRFGKKGLAINMVDSPKSRDDLQKIRQHFGKPIEKLDADDVDELERLEQR